MPGSQIVKVTLTDEDIATALAYARQSRDWTFDRMGVQAQGKAAAAVYRILIGVASQLAIARLVREKWGVRLAIEKKAFQNADLYDLLTPSGKTIDVKTFNLYRTRPFPTSAVFSGACADTWESFFPMLIPSDQYRTRKDYYIFGIIHADPPRQCSRVTNFGTSAVALPVSLDEDLEKELKVVRHAKETRSGKTGILRFRLPRQSSISTLSIDVGYETADSHAAIQRIILSNGGEPVEVRNAMGLHFVQLADGFSRELLEAGDPVLDMSLFTKVWHIRRDDFFDLLPRGAELNILGWVTGADFETARMSHPSHSTPSANPAGDYVPGSSDGGFLKRGTLCHIFPNGGTRTDNYYCLPQDLQPLDSFGVELGADPRLPVSVNGV